MPRGSVLLAAVSGGADSTAMLAAAARSCARLGSQLRCLHVVHGLRPDADGAADSDHVRGLCARFSVPCSVSAVPPGAIAERAARTGRGIEDAARRFRHRILAEEADRVGACRILMGHTDDDLLEHVLLRFLRGAGPAGLAALPADNGRILRPLLGLSRTDVRSYLRELELPHREDATNAELRYTRNRVRARLVPALDADFPGWRSAVRSLARAQAGVSRFLSAEASRRIVWTGASSGRDALETDGNAFFAEDPAIRTEALYQAADAVARSSGSAGARLSADPEPAADRDPKRAAVELFAAGAAAAQNLGKVRALKRGSSVAVEALETGGEASFSILLRDYGDYRRGNVAFSLGRERKPGSAAVSLPLAVRSVPRAELPRLRSAFGSSARDGSILFALEDGGGIAAVAVRRPDASIKLFSAERKPSETDYADRAFFSIL